jgi:hypothetical protein
MTSQVADSSIMGTMSSYANSMSSYANSAWNTGSTMISNVAGKTYACGKFGMNKCYEGMQKVMSYVKPLFAQIGSSVCNNKALVVACLAVGAGLYAAATQISGRTLGTSTSTTSATTTSA